MAALASERLLRILLFKKIQGITFKKNKKKVVSKYYGIIRCADIFLMRLLIKCFHLHFLLMSFVWRIWLSYPAQSTSAWFEWHHFPLLHQIPTWAVISEKEDSDVKMRGNRTTLWEILQWFRSASTLRVWGVNGMGGLGAGSGSPDMWAGMKGPRTWISHLSVGGGWRECIPIPI